MTLAREDGRACIDPSHNVPDCPEAAAQARSHEHRRASHNASACPKAQAEAPWSCCPEDGSAACRGHPACEELPCERTLIASQGEAAAGAWRAAFVETPLSQPPHAQNAAFADAATPWIYLLLAGAAATAIWRALGVLLASRVEAESEAMRWIRFVSTALIAALVARMLLFPTGALAETPLAGRVAAFLAGLVGFALSGRIFLSLALGVGLLAAIHGFAR